MDILWQSTPTKHGQGKIADDPTKVIHWAIVRRDGQIFIHDYVRNDRVALHRRAESFPAPMRDGQVRLACKAIKAPAKVAEALRRVLDL